MGEIDVKKLTDKELDQLLVEMILKMSPGQLAKAAEVVYADEEELTDTKEAS